MLYKHAIITALSVFGLIFGIALGISLYRHDSSLRNWVEYTWFVSIAASIIGFYLWKGARTGPDIAGFETESYTISNKDKYRDADNDDARVGMAFGTVVMLSSLLVFILSLTTLKCID
jgi:hypothetical protein